MAPSLEVNDHEDSGVLVEYHNPIIPGFAPDPSVVLVEGTYYLVTSSFHIFPGIPIYASKDLKTWTHIGNAITRQSQVDLTQTLTKAVPLDDGHTMIGAGGLFAPTIRHHNGTFYIICTNVACEGADFAASNFYITTKDISAEWSDPIPVNLHGIDPSLFIDDDGRAYVQGSWRLPRTEQPTSTIKQWEIDLVTGAQIGETREIWTGHSCIYTEGPHVYRKDGWYYLLVAEGGTFEHHHLSLARSRDIWGPYEGCPGNPVLTAEGKDELVQDAGHGELFRDADGLWWAAVLGVRKHGDGTRYPLGRESFLTPVDWPAGEWPELRHPQLTFRRAVPGLPRAKGAAFPSDARVADCYIRSPDLEKYEWSEDGGAVRMLSSAEDLTVAVGTASFVGKRQRRLEGAAAEATLDISGIDRARPLRAGLAVYKDDFRHAAIGFDAASSAVVLSLRNNAPADTEVGSVAVGPGVTALGLRIEASLEAYEFSYRAVTGAGPGEWRLLGAVDTAEMTARDFTGTIFGGFACHRGGRDEDAQWVTLSSYNVDP